MKFEIKVRKTIKHEDEHYFWRLVSTQVVVASHSVVNLFLFHKNI